MKKLVLRLLMVAMALVWLGGMSTLYASVHPQVPTPPPPEPPPATKSPVQLDSKPELKSPEPKAPIDLKAPEASKAPPKAPTGK
jgi:hypothetical protein